MMLVPGCMSRDILDLRTVLTRRLGIRRWVRDDREVAGLAGQARERITQFLDQKLPGQHEMPEPAD